MNASHPNQGPNQSAPRQISVWSKVNYDLVGQDRADDTVASGAVARDKLEAQARRWRRLRPILDIAGTLLWAYLFLQTFVLDVDHSLIARYVPVGQPLVDYKFLVFILLLATLVATLGRGDVVRVIMYICCFPLVVILWKVPKLLYKTNSWVAVLSVANVVSTAVINLRRSIIALAVALAAVVIILAAHDPSLIVIGIIMAGGFLGAALYHAIRYAFAPSAFLHTQERAIDRLVHGEFLTNLIRVKDDLRNADVELFSAAQQTQFLSDLSMGVLSHRILYFWAYQLDRYRRSAVPIVFSIVAFLFLLLTMVVGLTLINYGLYRVDIHAFTFSVSPSFFTFARYAFTSLYGSEIEALHPLSIVANGVALGSMFLGVGMLGTFILTLFNSRRERQDIAAQETIRRIKRHGAAFEKRIQEDYEVGIKVAIERLRKLESGLVGAITFVSNRIPSSFEETTG